MKTSRIPPATPKPPHDCGPDARSTGNAINNARATRAAADTNPPAPGTPTRLRQP